MGKDNKKLGVWLDQMGLANSRRLAEHLEVSAGWENAAETVLGSNLEAICTDNAAPFLPELHQLHDSSLTLFETNNNAATETASSLIRLLDKVTAPWDLSPLLSGVYCAENVETARTLSLDLKPYESVITPRWHLVWR